ncbi:glycosyltransferase family 4 protein [Candidatus Sumerlaeota bacterium]|nr:glycosyltransferase family 4 protein [Candidatus Sumerlaeota bacterium]
MKICFLAEINNVHTRRWIKYFADLGSEILVLSDNIPKPAIPSVKIIKPEMNLFTKFLAFKIHPKPYGNNSFKWIAYRKEVNRFKPDIVHAMEAVGYGLAMALCGNYPKILTPWGNDIYHDPFHSRIARFHVKKALNAATIISTNHPTLGDYLFDAFHAPKDKVNGFSWGIDLRIFNPHKQREAWGWKTSLKIPTNVPVIMSNRNFAEYWGAREIVNAIPVVLKEYPKAHFIIIRGSGGEDFYGEMTRFLENSGALKNVRIINEKISPGIMAALLNLSDIFISVPYSDLLSVSLLEGLACGAVPVASDLPAYKSRIVENENGFYVPIKDSDAIAQKVIHIIKNISMRKKIQERNWRIVRENDDWEKCAPQMLAVYEEAIKKYKACRNV